MRELRFVAEPPILGEPFTVHTLQGDRKNLTVHVECHRATQGRSRMTTKEWDNLPTTIAGAVHSYGNACKARLGHARFLLVSRTNSLAEAEAAALLSDVKVIPVPQRLQK